MRQVPPLHPQAKLVQDRIAQLEAGLVPPVPLEVMRAAMSKRIDMLVTPAPPVGRIVEKQLGATSVPCRIYYPESNAEAALPVVVLIHGGGFVVGDLDMLETISRIICSEARVAVINVGYRLSPESKFPAAIDDTIGVCRWVAAEGAANGLDPMHVVIAGESAGGNLAAVAAQSLSDTPGLNVVFQVLVYPVTDFTMSQPSYTDFATGYPLTAEKMRVYSKMYLNGEDEARDPRASPLLAASLDGQPPALVIVAGLDPLVDEGVAYSRRLQEHQVETELVVVPDYPHGFLGWLRDSDAARDAMALVVDRIRCRTRR